MISIHYTVLKETSTWIYHNTRRMLQTKPAAFDEKFNKDGVAYARRKEAGAPLAGGYPFHLM